MSVESAKAKLDAQPGDPATGYISKADHQDSYTELVDDTALTGATTAEALTISGNLNGRDPDNLVAGPASATDNALVRFDGTGGKTVQGSGITVDDSNNISGVGTFGSGAVTSSGAVQAAAAAGFVVGSSGPRIMSGTGSPEGVVTAPVGSMWTDEAATTGAIRWIKASGAGNTGWVVEYGNTGIRNIAATATPHVNTTLTYLQVQRQGTAVTLMYYQATSSLVSDVLMFDALPVGFRPTFSVQAIRNRGDILNASDQIVWDVRSSGRVYYSSAGGWTMQGEVTWQTPDPWPASLLGTA